MFYLYHDLTNCLPNQCSTNKLSNQDSITILAYHGSTKFLVYYCLPKLSLYHYSFAVWVCHDSTNSRRTVVWSNFGCTFIRIPGPGPLFARFVRALWFGCSMIQPSLVVPWFDQSLVVHLSGPPAPYHCSPALSVHSGSAFIPVYHGLPSVPSQLNQRSTTCACIVPMN